MLRRIFRYIMKVVLAIISLIAVYLGIALLLSFIPTSPDVVTCNQKTESFIATNGVHLEIILPKTALPEELQQELRIDSVITYVSFGWGDRTFYLDTPEWSDLKFSTAVNALFFTSESALHLTYYRQPLNHWLTVPLCDKQLASMLEYLDGTFKRDENGNIIEIEDSGYYANDTFYEAEGSYSCIKTCNTWVNVGLKRAKVKTSIWSPFDKGTLYQIRKQQDPID